MRLKDKVVIVTGSCTGIGKAIAKRCVAEGANVVIHGLERALGEALVADLGANRAVLHIEEITNEQAPQHLVDLAIATFGKLNAIVNNAALVASSTIQTTDLALFRKILDVNTLAPFALLKAALPHLQAHRGCALDIGSVNAWSGEHGLMAYSVSKGALVTMTRNLGDTLHREIGVRVNQINPGWVLTERELERKREQGFSDNWYTTLSTSLSPAGRMLLPDEIAAAAIYWLADESGPISGQIVDLEQFPVIGRFLPKL